MDVNVQNVHSLTTFELRQELEKKGVDLEKELDGNVNYNTMLQKMVQLLLEETELKNNGGCTNEEEIQKAQRAEADRLKEELLQKREQRKKEAMERSKKRQADRNYFKQKEEANKKAAEEEKEEKKKQASLVNDISHIEEAEDDSEEDENKDSWQQPRYKVFVK
mmetsp:Transcript_28163/g.36899  ORF Transcript_28163/g.36899 Transcript_28163/m.36899 type:complete len:164 (+) Transcript_28163:220-711(+)